MVNERELALRNTILFDSSRKVEIPTTTKDVNLVEAVTANKEFSRYGFSLDARGIMNLAHNSPDDIAAIKDVICEVMDETVGLSDFEHSEPFYPNFPEEVMEKSELELEVNAILYYAFSQTDDKEMQDIANEIRSLVVSGPEDRIEREKLPVDEDKLKIVVTAGPTAVEDLIHDRTQAMSISSGHLDHIKEYAKEYQSTWVERIFGSGDSKDVSIPSHETRSNIAMIAYRGGDLESTRMLLPNAEDVLRFASVLSAEKLGNSGRVTMDANLSFEAKDAKFSLSRSDKTAIKGLLDKSPDLFTSIWHRPDMWEKLMNRLDTKDDRFPRMEKAFDNLRNKDRVDERGVEVRPSAGQELEKLVSAIKMDPANSRVDIEAFASKHPKVFIRNVERICRDIAPNSESVRGVCEGIEKNASNIPAGQLLKLEKHIERADGWDYRIFTNQKGGIHAEENNTRGIDIRTKAAVIDALDKAIEKNLVRDPVGKVYIAPELSGITLPMRNQRDASDGATLTKYSTLEGSVDNNIAAFGIFWSNDGMERADIDLSVTGFKEGYRDPEVVYYGHLKTDWGVHSGDYTSGVIAPEINGAVEYVFVDKQKCEQLGIRYLVPEVHGFNVPFSKAETVRFCFMEKNGSLYDASSRSRWNYDGSEMKAPTFKGEVINPTEMNTSYRLTQDSRVTVPLIYDVKEDKYIWVDKDIAVGRIANVIDDVTRNKTALVLYEARHNDYPSIGEIAERYVKANGGEIVKDIKEADVVFSFGNIDEEAMELKEGVEVISSFDLDKISAEFSNAIEQTKPDTEREKGDAVTTDGEDEQSDVERQCHEEYEEYEEYYDSYKD